MDNNSIKTVMIVFGGRSAEHEVSILSAKNICRAVDKKNYRVLLVGISRNGDWYLLPNEEYLFQIKNLDEETISPNLLPVGLVSQKSKPTLFSLTTNQKFHIDVAFPVLHGTFGEDGAPQGLFRMVNLPFVGCGVLGSAMAMDKEIMKRVLASSKVPFAKYRLLRQTDQINYSELVTDLGTPFFIKPANAGSSVGVHKIKSFEDFEKHLKDSFLYDHKVIAEEFIEGREIECSVIGLNSSPKASLPGEVTPHHEFYSYEAKYLDANGAKIIIPAPLSDVLIRKVQDLAQKVYTLMECDGLTRVDFFLKSNNELLINELNTIPGFTQISMYPKMWESSGVSFSELISQLLDLALKKYAQDEKLKIKFN